MWLNSSLGVNVDNKLSYGVDLGHIDVKSNASVKVPFRDSHLGDPYFTHTKMAIMSSPPCAVVILRLKPKNLGP